LFGGEGLFFATLRGPGRVWMQSLPLSRLANRIIKSAPAAGGRSVGEGSLLGGSRLAGWRQLMFVGGQSLPSPAGFRSLSGVKCRPQVCC
jgi:hypothetical protein